MRATNHPGIRAGKIGKAWEQALPNCLDCFAIEL